MPATPDDPVSSSLPSDPGFLADLKSAVAVWRHHPFLPLLALTWAALGFIDLVPSFYLAAFIQVGWIGVERIWYLRAFTGDEIAPRELFPLWRAFFWRFATLALMVFVPLAIIAGIVRPDTTTRAVLLISGFSVLADLALTFVTPALAFSTNRVRDGLRIGFAMIRDEWPGCVLYVLVAPIAFEAVVGMRLVAPFGTVASRAFAICTVLVALAFKGAIAAFYLRRHASGRDGAAWVDGLPAPQPGLKARRRAQSSSVRRRIPNVPEPRLPPPPKPVRRAPRTSSAPRRVPNTPESRARRRSKAGDD